MLYHKSQPVFQNFVSQIDVRCFDLKYSRHAKNASYSDLYGKVELPSAIRFELSNIFEIEINELGQVCKIGIRLPYNEKLDTSFVINPNGFVRTVWFNQKNDNHKTLRKENYD